MPGCTWGMSRAQSRAAQAAARERDRKAAAKRAASWERMKADAARRVGA